MTKVHRQGIDSDQAVLAGLRSLGVLTGEDSVGAGIFILAHGAGALMDSEFMQCAAERLARRGVTALRFEFDYMSNRRLDGVKRPPPRLPKLLEEFEAVLQQLRALGISRVVVGGKSMGGRVASMLSDEMGVVGVVCLGYPFHPIGRPDALRIDHLFAVHAPLLIVQGERDRFGDQAEVASYQLPNRVQFHWVADGDHDFKPLKRSGVDGALEMVLAMDSVAAFVKGCLSVSD